MGLLCWMYPACVLNITECHNLIRCSRYRQWSTALFVSYLNRTTLRALEVNLLHPNTLPHILHTRIVYTAVELPLDHEQAYRTTTLTSKTQHLYSPPPNDPSLPTLNLSTAYLLPVLIPPLKHWCCCTWPPYHSSTLPNKQQRFLTTT